MHKAPSPDQRLGRLAARHHGLVTRSDALDCGLSDRQIKRRVDAGLWARLGPGVYRSTSVATTPAQRAYATVLIAGSEAVVCGLSALALVGVGKAPDVPSICVPPTASARTPGAVVRRAVLPASDRCRVGPIPSSTPARALLEVAALVPEATLEGLVDDVVCRRLASPAQILAVIRQSTRGQGRTGASRLRRAVSPWLDGIVPDSPAEARLVRRLDDWALPGPQRQHRVALPSGDVYLDLAWPEHLVGLEYDGQRWHTPRRVPADVAREDALRALGWWVGRVDRYDLSPSSVRVRDELRARLGLRAA